VGHQELDIPGWLTWTDGLPCPKGDAIRTWVETRCEPEARWDALAAAVRHWLARLGPALGGGYELLESRHFLALAPEADGIGRRLLPFAERSRSALLSLLGEVADFHRYGPPLVVLLRTRDFYRYISLYYPEGEHAALAGVHVREGYPHVVLHASEPWELESTLAHELTHAALHHLSLPLWVEEGLAQMVEHGLTGRSPLRIDEERADAHRRYWRTHGLDAFWTGEAFPRADKAGELGYELAEILVRLLVEDFRPAGSGGEAEPPLLAFLRAASESDCGEAASREHLGIGLCDLAARFLGPGFRSPGVTT
jgi:hypothetical protein